VTFTQLISTDSLLKIINQPDLIILDASIPPVGGQDPAIYSWPLHSIKNAKRFDLKGDFSDLNSSLTHTLPKEEQFQYAARKLGINRESQIIIYDDLGIYSSARAWWMFKAMGHKNVAVLDGGLPKWMSEGKETSTTEEAKIAEGNFNAKYQQGYFCDSDYVLKSIDSLEIRIIDARGEKRFLGTIPEPRAGVRSGHIPHSRNLPYSKLILNGTLRSPEKLKSIFSQCITNEKAIIFSCGSGITACILALAADVIGLPSLCVYDGSWADWGADHKLPIVTG